MPSRFAPFLALAIAHLASAVPPEILATESIPRTPREQLSRGGLESLLDAPAGTHGFVQASADARLVFEDGTPACFFGVCHNTYTNSWQEEIDPEKIRGMLDELAALGVNLVRMFSVPGVIDHGAFCDGLNPTAMANRDLFIAEARKRGIYVHINLGQLGGSLKQKRSPFASELGATHVANLIVSDRVVEARQRFIRALLNHVNPHTGLAYKDDPAIISWQLGNELHAYSRGWGGKGPGFADWTSMGEPYRQELVGKWQAYLRGKYADRGALAKAWGDLLKPEEDPTTGTVALTNPIYPRWFDTFVPDPRVQDAIDFADSLQHRYYQTMRRTIREEVGDTKHLISDNGWIRGSDRILATAAEELDLMDLQHYWPHMSFRRTPLKPNLQSPLKDMGLGMLESLLTARGTAEHPRPGIVTEYNGHVDCVNSGEVYPVHSLLARLAGVDGEAAWYYMARELYWDHWFGMNRNYSPLPERLIPFAAASLLWRQDIPASDVKALDEAITAMREKLSEVSIDRDGTTTQLAEASAGRFPATPKGIDIDFARGVIHCSQPGWQLFMGTGPAKDLPIAFEPTNPEQRYLLAAFALDGRPLAESRQIRLFANTEGIGTISADDVSVYPCDRFGRALRYAQPKDGRFSARDCDQILFYDLARPTTTAEIKLEKQAWIREVTASNPHFGGNSVERLIDGDVSTRYMASRTPGEFPQSVTFTFDGPHAIQTMTMYALSGLDSSPALFDIQIPDGEGWRTVRQCETRWLNWDDKQGVESREFTFPKVETDRIRLVLRKVNMGWNGYNIHEIQLH
jgi:hypothetical protein